jgi:hypothetical protein
MTESKMPDAYDRQLAALHNLPDVVKTRPATVRVVPTLGIGGTQIIVVQTIRQAHEGDTIFLEVMGQDGSTRLVLPPKVAALIARQRDALSAKARSKAGRERAEADAAAGIKPGFLRAAK